MEPGLQIVFRHYRPEALVLARVRARFAALQGVNDDVVRCHVDLERKLAGQCEHFRVFVQLTLVRGDVLRVDDDRALPHDDMAHAVDRAFDALTTLLHARAAGSRRDRAVSLSS